MANKPEVITTLFDQQADNYQSKNIEGMLAHYAENPDLLMWSHGDVVCRTHGALKIWYESLFAQFDIQSVEYRVESFWESDSVMGVCSIWQFETMMNLEGAALELQSLRATHILNKQDGEWKIVHLHASSK